MWVWLLTVLRTLLYYLDIDFVFLVGVGPNHRPHLSPPIVVSTNHPTCLDLLDLKLVVLLLGFTLCQ